MIPASLNGSLSARDIIYWYLLVWSEPSVRRISTSVSIASSVVAIRADPWGADKATDMTRKCVNVWWRLDIVPPHSLLSQSVAPLLFAGSLVDRIGMYYARTRSVAVASQMLWGMTRDFSVALKLTFWQYPAIHTNYIICHCTTLKYNHNTWHDT